mmetsp:Transcript_44765/g.71146  ORF Transcript_44765/g.71146 Transcript_44765/m.71146 type:complete len:284 (+) Transcript_44765:186-1037(+)
MLPQLSYGLCIFRQLRLQSFWHQSLEQSIVVWAHFYANKVMLTHDMPENPTTKLVVFSKAVTEFFSITPTTLNLPVLLPRNEINCDIVQSLSGHCFEVFLSNVHLMCLGALVHLVQPESNHSIHQVDGLLHCTHKVDALLELLTIQAMVSFEVGRQTFALPGVLLGLKVGKVGDAIYHSSEAGGNLYTCGLGDSHQASPCILLLLRRHLLKSTSLSKDQVTLRPDCRHFALSHMLIKLTELRVHVVVDLADSLVNHLLNGSQHGCKGTAAGTIPGQVHDHGGQ